MSMDKVSAFWHELNDLEEKYDVCIFASQEFYPDEVDEDDNGYRDCLFIYDNESGNVINIEYGLPEIEHSC